MFRKFILLVLNAILYFQLLATHIIPVPYYSQKDSRWSSEQLGTYGGCTIGHDGCVLTCMTMLLAANGCNVNPSSLNQWLINRNGGYSSGCLINNYDQFSNYNGATLQYNGIVYYNSSNPSSFLNEIKNEIDNNNPVLVRVCLTSDCDEDHKHSIIVNGYVGDGTSFHDFIVQDPYWGANLRLDNYHYASYAYIRKFRNVISYYPTNYASNVSIPVNFYWSQYGASDVQFRIQISTTASDWSYSSGFSSPIVNLNTGSQNYYSWSGAGSNTTYYWTYKVYINGVSSYYSTPIRFTTEGSSSCDPPTVTILSPNENDIYSSGQTIHFQWQGDGHGCNVVSYKMYVGNPLGEVNESSETSQTSVDYTLSSSNKSGKYTFGFKAKNENGVWGDYTYVNIYFNIDTYEPNNSSSSAYNIGSNTSLDDQYHLFLTSNDQDWFKFTYAGRTYYFKVVGYSSSTIGEYGLRFNRSNNHITIETYPPYSDSHTDTKLYLYDSNLNQLASDDDGGTGRYSKIEYDLPIPQPDLIVQNPSASSTTVHPGDNITVSCRIKNQGDGDAGSSYVGYYLSTDNTWSSSDTYLGNDYVSSLSSGSYSNESETVTIPSSLSSGYYYIIFKADYQNNVSESNENNNTAYVQIHVVPRQYTITLYTNPSNGGNVSGSGTYNEGSQITVHASPNTGWRFENWTENSSVVSSNADYTFTVSSNRTLTANFESLSYQVTADVSPSGAGTVSGTGTYNYGQTATLTATANTGYVFTTWTDDNGNVVSTSSTYSFTVTGDVHLTAHFTQQTYQVTASVSPAGSGSVSGTGTYNYGQTATLTATANSGYIFGNWTDDNGNVVSTSSTYSFTVTSDVHLTANFSISTAVSEIRKDNNRIYPVPSKDYVIVQFPSIEEVNIYTLDGKLLINKSFSAVDKCQIGLKGLSNGTYIIQIKTSDNKVYTTKFIKQ